MSLKYSILWIEDSDSFIDSFRPIVYDIVSELGFKPNFKIIHGIEDCNEVLEDESFNLILLDFNLDDSGNGNEIVKTMREKGNYTETIFYSSHITKKADPHLSGVFLTERENLKEKVEIVIELTIKKSQDITYLRGLVIAESIDIEAKMDSLLLLYFGSDNEKSEVFQKLIDPKFNVISFKNKYDMMNKICKERKNSLNKLLQENTEIPQKKEEIKDQLEMLGKIQKEIKNIETEIIEIRNILAHVQEDPSKRNVLLSDRNKQKEPIVVDDEWCKNTRKNILKHSQNLDGFLQYIGS